LEVGLQQLWSAEELANSRGGRLYNVQQLAWHPDGNPELTPQDMYQLPEAEAHGAGEKGFEKRALGFYLAFVVGLS
jgi:hypothetical protein